MKKDAVIFDVDGTLAHMNGRIARHGGAAPYLDWDAYDDDPDDSVRKILIAIENFYDVIICSGRKSSSYDVLKKWLDTNGIPYNALFMRDKDDNRKDSIVKREIYLEKIEPIYNVIGVFDDRNQVVDEWRSLGLKCFQVQPGDF